MASSEPSPVFPPLPESELPTDAVEVGRIGDAWGVKGWFKVLAHSAQPAALLAAKQWFLAPASLGPRNFSGTRALSIQSVREHSGGLVAQSLQVPDRQNAEALKGARVFVSRLHFPKTQNDEYYWVDLMGLDVINREGVNLGKVQNLLSTGAQTVLQIDYIGEDGKTAQRMIPFVAAYIDGVDLPARLIRADWQPDY